MRPCCSRLLRQVSSAGRDVAEGKFEDNVDLVTGGVNRRGLLRDRRSRCLEDRFIRGSGGF